MPLTITKLGRISVFGAARSVRFSGLHNKCSLSYTSHVICKTNTDNTDADPEVASGGDVPANVLLSNRVHALEEGSTILSSKVDTGFKHINDRFDAFDRKFDAFDRKFDGLDRRLDRIDSKIDGWVKWGFRIGLGLVGTGILAIWDAKREIHQNQKEIHQNQKETQKFIRESITESEGRLGSKIKESGESLESKLMLAFMREVKENARVELQHVVGKTQK
ncbi:hypothetical protein HOY82DRAFT_542659 [Tuber indicum]|nr:hypothetical protein HOY82DRAFT_542659 [Tuber indicum]